MYCLGFHVQFQQPDSLKQLAAKKIFPQSHPDTKLWKLSRPLCSLCLSLKVKFLWHFKGMPVPGPGVDPGVKASVTNKKALDTHELIYTI